MRIRSVSLLLKHGIMLCVAFIACACEHKELCYDHSHVVELDIRFDWSEALASELLASKASPSDALPSTMVVQFFTTDGRYYESRELSNDGGKIRIEAGEYKLLFHNGGMETVDEQGDRYDDYKLSGIPQTLLDPMGRGEMKGDTPPRPEGTEEEPVRATPEMVWGGSHEYLNLEVGMEGQTVTLTPTEATAEYSIEIRNIENWDNELDFSAALSGMAQSWRIADSTPCAKATLSFGLRPGEDENHDPTLVARFFSFGHCPEEESKHILSIYTSNKYHYTRDVTDRLHETLDAKHIEIIIDGLKLPGSGVNPDMEDWGDNEEDIEIDMN
ncbi:DUF5119 domain-containing protein [uncultured Bacteroides sp.]|uniref:DUF5119 domain-containing protein n=1 Tax=uncultured Bacteroides sp. TaxID=162156 RepID=UPI00260027D5|nr:DUF5119 domain-containing protein [uncultured Bacteroides sp.]